MDRLIGLKALKCLFTLKLKVKIISQYCLKNAHYKIFSNCYSSQTRLNMFFNKNITFWQVTLNILVTNTWHFTILLKTQYFWTISCNITETIIRVAYIKKMHRHVLYKIHRIFWSGYLLSNCCGPVFF